MEIDHEIIIFHGEIQRSMAPCLDSRRWWNPATQSLPGRLENPQTSTRILLQLMTSQYEWIIMAILYTYIHTIPYHCIPYHCITLHYIALHCIALHYITLHCITLHYITYIRTNVRTYVHPFIHTYIHKYMYIICVCISIYIYIYLGDRRMDT